MRDSRVFCYACRGGRRSLPARRGFTLIELLVVIAIIALLMAILVPILNKVRSQARAVVCQSNLHQWALFFHAYTDDNDGKWFYHHTEDKRAIFWNSYGMNELWLSIMYPYWKDCNEVLLCPEASDHEPWADTDRLGGSTFSAWLCPCPPAGTKILGSYGFNTYIYHRGRDRRSRHGTRREWWGTPHVKNAARIPVLADAITCHISMSRFLSPLPAYEHIQTRHQHGSLIDRHNGGINMLFMDWSVRKVGLKELYTLKWHRFFDTANMYTKAGGVRPEDWPKWMRKFKDY